MRIAMCVVLIAACGDDTVVTHDATPSLEVFPITPTVVVNGHIEFTASDVVTWSTDGGEIDADGVFRRPRRPARCTSRPAPDWRSRRP